MANRLKVLVFDDTAHHRQAATLLLSKDYDLTVVGTYDEAQNALNAVMDFDIVLTDLLVPASQQAMSEQGQKFVGQEMPLGTIIALLALCNGVKKVAVVTDMDHHNHPSSAAFDCFKDKECRLRGINIMCTNRPGIVTIDKATGKLVERAFLETNRGKKKYPYPPGESWGKREGLSYGKNWKRVLLQLTGELKTE